MPELSWFEDYGENNVPGFDLSTLLRDQVYLNVTESAQKYFLYTKYRECVDCYYSLWDTDRHALVLSKVPEILYRLSPEKNPNDILFPNETYLCEFGSEFHQYGIYNLAVDETTNKCKIDVIKDGVNIGFPVLTVALIYLGLCAIIFGSIKFYKTLIQKIKSHNTKEKSSNDPTQRVQSLDTFRGISIAVMIFVNYGAGGYEILDHAHWNGLHVADLVFPCFLWIMGVCIPISLTSSIKKGNSNSAIFWNVFKRSIKLFCLGVFLNGGSTLECLRIFAVLQRFGISYLVATVTCLLLMQRDTEALKQKMTKFTQHIIDILQLWKAWIFMLILLLAHCLITFLVAEEGCPKGYLGPGGKHKLGLYYHCTGGATGYIDRLILGKHLYKYPTIGEIYSVGDFDPEGILGCLTSIVHAFIGVQAGMILIVYKKHHQRLIRWLVWSVLTGIVGGALCGFSKEDGVIPVNKNLWSISFVLVTCSIAFLLLSICYFLIDVKRWWSGKPFLFAGMNAILLYVGHSMCGGHFPADFSVFCDQGPNTHFFMFFENVWGSVFWVSVSYYWYKINYFFTI